MRHIVGFFLALAMSAALFFGGGWGVARIIAISSGHGMALHALTNIHNVLPIAAVLGTGLLLGILMVMRRVSPLATGLPGLVLLAWSALVIMRGSNALSFMPLPGSHYAAGFTSMLVSGALALLGAAMILPLFTPSRWHSDLVEVDDLGDDDYSVRTALGLAP